MINVLWSRLLRNIANLAAGRVLVICILHLVLNRMLHLLNMGLTLVLNVLLLLDLLNLLHWLLLLLNVLSLFKRLKLWHITVLGTT